MTGYVSGAKGDPNCYHTCKECPNLKAIKRVKERPIEYLKRSRFGECKQCQKLK